MFRKLTTAKRVQAAKQKTERVVDHLLYLLALHESNTIVVYSDTLSKQIPRSYAANAFNLFRQCMSHFEIVRLCALWDPPNSPNPDRESIPTVVELIKHPAVINALVEETRANWVSGMPMDSEAREELSLSLEQRAHKKAIEARAGIKQSIRRARQIERSPLLTSVRNLRNKHLAHSLSETRREKKGPVLPVKPGDERKLFLDSLTLVKELHLWVNGRDFLFDNSREIARRNAEELWKHCAFNIQSRGELRND
jgi:hypothetical protein